VAVPALITATDGGPDVSLALVTWLAIMPLVVLFAALALWRNLAWARPVLLVLVALSGIASVLFLGRPAVAAAALAGAIVTGWGAFRLRIPPPTVPADRPDATLSTEELAPGDLAGRPGTGDPALRAFLDRAAHLDPDRTRVLGAAWRAIDPDERHAAWAVIKAEAGGTGRGAQLDQLRTEIELWGRAAGGSPWTWEFATMTDVDRSNVRRAAMPALIDAAAAILLRDRLDDAVRDTLLAPWEAALATPVTDPAATPRLPGPADRA